MASYYLGIDVGGSHITLDLIDSVSFRPLSGATVRKALDTHDEPAAVLAVFDAAIRECAAKADGEVLGVGLAIPGPFEYARGICRITPGQKKYDLSFGVNFRQSLSRALPGKPVLFVNDAAGFALGEYFNGSAKGFRRPVVVTLGTGFGASFLLEGRPQQGSANCPAVAQPPATPNPDHPVVPTGGELWHIPFLDKIADDIFGTRWLIAEYARVTGRTLPGGKEIAQAAFSGDEAARQVYATFAINLAEFIAPWLAGFGADAFVIGGNLARDWELFAPIFEAELKKRLPNQPVAVKPCALGEGAPVVGAALAQTLVDPQSLLPGELPPSFKGFDFILKELVKAASTVKRLRLDGSEKIAWDALVNKLDAALLEQGIRVVWFDAASRPHADIRADETALSVAYGPTAEQVPWGDDVQTLVLGVD